FENALNDTSGLPCSCKDALRGNRAACGDIDVNVARTFCYTRLTTDDTGKGGPYLGKCLCVDALTSNPLCGNVTSQVRAFCENPMSSAIALGTEDGRIKRRVK